MLLENFYMTSFYQIMYFEYISMHNNFPRFILRRLVTLSSTINLLVRIAVKLPLVLVGKCRHGHKQCRK